MTYQMRYEPQNDIIYLRMSGNISYGVLMAINDELAAMLMQATPRTCQVVVDASDLNEFPTDIKRLQSILTALHAENLDALVEWGNYDYRFHFVLSVLMQIAGVEFNAFASESDALQALGIHRPVHSSYRWL